MPAGRCVEVAVVMGDDAPEAPRWLAPVATVLGLYLLAFIAWAVIAQRGLIADGAGYLVPILTRHAVFSAHVSRWSANLLTQWPILLALQAGVQDLTALSWLYGLGLYYLAPATLLAAWLLLPPTRKALILLPLITVAFGWMAGCYAAISQSLVIALWFWPAAFALGLGRPDRAGSIAAMIVFVLPMLLMHEAMGFLGPILLAIVIHRAQGPMRRRTRALWIALALWLVTASAIGLYFSLFPEFPAHRRDFIGSITRFRFLHDGWSRPNPPVVVALVSAGLLLGCLLAPDRLRSLRLFWGAPYVLLLVVAGFSPLLFPSHFAPELQSAARSWVVGVPAASVLALVAARTAGLHLAPGARPMLFGIVALAMTAQITWQLAATWRWSGLIAQFQTQLATRQGFVPWDTAFAGTGRPTAAEIAATSWTFPDISIVLAPAGQVRAIVGNPDPEGWQPFNPRRPEELPRIPGVDYGPYLAALAASAGG
jgi:hypothetical protein